MSQHSPQVVIVTTDDAFEARLRTTLAGMLDGDLWRCETVDAGPGVGGLEPHWDGVEVLALGPGLPIELALDIAAKVDRERPEVSILLHGEATPDVWQQALRAGVRDVVPAAAPDEELLYAYGRALETARRRRENLLGDVAKGPASSVITVVSPKGGSGKTTVASNLAVGLAAAAPDEVVIVDLDLQFGDVASALQLAPEASMLDVTRADLTDSVALKVYLTPHPAGLYALCAPESPADGEEITAAHVTRVLRLLSAEFPYVVVDTSAGLNEHALAALELSTDIICLCSMDVPSIRSLRKELQALDLLGMTTPRRHFVVNRADSRVGLDISDIEATIGMTVDVQIPSSRAVPLSLNQGSPVLQTEPRSAVGRQLSALAKRLVHGHPGADGAGRGGFLRRRRDAA